MPFAIIFLKTFLKNIANEIIICIFFESKKETPRLTATAIRRGGKCGGRRYEIITVIGLL